MNRPNLVFLVLPIVLGAATSSLSADAPAAIDVAAEKTSLFDGKTLRGWEGDGAYFRVQEGCIVAGNLKSEIPHNYFLCSEQTFKNFDLELEVKLVGEGENAGVQFRSRRVDDSTEVSGYQADAGRAWKRSVWGALYDESRRRKMLAEGDPELVERLTKPGDWNHLRIVCRDDRVQIFFNGERTVDYAETEADIPRQGVIGLQIHSGPPTEAWYRNIRLRKLAD